MTRITIAPESGIPGFSLAEVLAANVRTCSTPHMHPYLCLCVWIIRAEAESVVR